MDLDGKDWAFLSTDKNTLLIGEGPFQQHAECPIGTTAFYKNTFDLSAEKPWYVPARIHQLSRESLKEFFPNNDDLTEIDWSEPDVSCFATVFRDIMDEIEAGQLQKSVPVAVEKARTSCETFLNLPRQLARAHPNLHPYGFWENGSGFVGASPEFLFRSFEGKLTTMALAGTATESERAVFSVDQKEIQEHEFVANTLQETLLPLGMTRRHQRSILSLGELIHFHTRIDVELYNSHRPDDLIKHLHPTPALGSLPRTTETMAQLDKWRQDLGCPAYFGSPFGVYHQGKLDLLVAIRTLGYESGELILPSGCGIIEASRLTSEWRELNLKRKSVKRFFGLHYESKSKS